VAADAFGKAMATAASAVMGGMAWLYGGLFNFINHATTPDVTASWFSGANSPFGRVLTIAVTLLAIMVIFAIIQAVVSGDPGAIGRRLLIELPTSVVLMVSVLAVVDFAVKITDAASADLLAGAGKAGTAWAQNIVAQGAHYESLAVLSVVGLLGSLMMLACLVVWVELLLRSSLIYLLVALSPLMFALRVWPVTRPIGHKAGHYLAGFIVAKLVVAIALAVGMAGLTGGAAADTPAPTPPGVTITAAGTGSPASPSSPAAPGGTGTGTGTGTDPAVVLGNLLGGFALLAMAAFTPMLVVRLLPLAEGAISAGSGGRFVAKAAMAAKALS
jgi:hypothetical protein